jgi:hypothetical protein
MDVPQECMHEWERIAVLLLRHGLPLTPPGLNGGSFWKLDSSHRVDTAATPSSCFLTSLELVGPGFAFSLTRFLSDQGMDKSCQPAWGRVVKPDNSLPSEFPIHDNDFLGADYSLSSKDREGKPPKGSNFPQFSNHGFVTAKSPERHNKPIFICTNCGRQGFAASEPFLRDGKGFCTANCYMSYNIRAERGG